MSRTVHHVGMAVSDLDRSIEFYELLGFTRSLEAPLTVAEPWTGTVTGFDDASLLVMFLALEGTTLELIQYQKPVGTAPGSLKGNDAGSAHLAIEVDDVEGEHARLAESGVKFVSEPIHVTEGGFEGLRAVYGLDPDGNTFELLSGLG